MPDNIKHDSKRDTSSIFPARKRGGFLRSPLESTKIKEFIESLKKLQRTDPYSFDKFIKIFNFGCEGDTLIAAAVKCGYSTERPLQKFLKRCCFNVNYSMLVHYKDLRNAIETEFAYVIQKSRPKETRLPTLEPDFVPVMQINDTIPFTLKRKRSDQEEPHAKRQKIEIPTPAKVATFMFFSPPQQQDGDKINRNANSAFYEVIPGI
jgi:hypothetical protein